jgi:hypothetical protein
VVGNARYGTYCRGELLNQPPLAREWQHNGSDLGRHFGRGHLLQAAGMIGLIIAVIVAIIVIGIVLKLLKIAIILAIAIGIVMFAQNKLGRNNDGGRLK